MPSVMWTTSLPFPYAPATRKSGRACPHLQTCRNLLRRLSLPTHQTVRRTMRLPLVACPPPLVRGPPSRGTHCKPFPSRHPARDPVARMSCGANPVFATCPMFPFSNRTAHTNGCTYLTASPATVATVSTRSLRCIVLATSTLLAGGHRIGHVDARTCHITMQCTRSREAVLFQNGQSTVAAR